MNRVFLYARVSTKNHGQDPETQLIALREYAAARGLQIVGEYVDSGISGSQDRRPQLEELMKHARQRKFDAVLVARFDRFARSVRHLVMALDEFNSLGVDFISLSEAVDTSTPTGRMVFTVLGAVAELERSLIRERVLMGLDRARKQGKKLGRPRGTRIDVQLAQQLKAKGLSVREIAKVLNTSKTTISRVLNDVPKNHADSRSC
jgi:DNA invertase Pin-like site-specific DNA recombinase